MDKMNATTVLYLTFSFAFTYLYYAIQAMTSTSKKELATKFLYLPIFFFVSIPCIIYMGLKWVFVNAFSKEEEE